MKNMTKYMLPAVLFLFMAAYSLLFAASAFAETLRILEWGAYVPKAYQEKIVQLAKEKYNIDLELDLKTVESNDEFFPALRDKKADIITPSHNVPRDERWRLIKHRLVLPLDLKNIPNYKNVDPGLQKADYCTEGGEVYAVPIARGPYGLAYNTAMFKEAPKSWNVLWDPKFKGKYSIGKHQYEENIFSTALAMGFAKADISNYKKLNTPEFQKKLTQLVSNAHAMWEGVDKPEDLKGLALAAVWGDSLPGLKKAGEEWKIAEPKEGTTAWVDNFMISHTLKDKPKLKQLAEELLNMVLSDENQVNVAREGTIPVVSTIMDKLTPEEIARCKLNDPDHFKNNRVLWPTLKKLNRKGLKRLWDVATKVRK
ncbi:MAG: extracellular solute-binding protein [Deltaproteobacteria bacterium]|nr:extracellular solute-binding protein [Deltaproteobacteria bacterium]